MEDPVSPSLNHGGRIVQLERLMIPFIKSSKCCAKSMGFFLCSMETFKQGSNPTSSYFGKITSGKSPEDHVK